MGARGTRKVLLDLSVSMLREVPRRYRGDAAFLRQLDLLAGDAARPPFRPGVFGEAVVLGNVVGFGATDAEAIVQAVADLVSPNGRLLLELAAGSGESSRYLTRLPPGAVVRLFRSPATWLVKRINREGFVPGPASRGPRATFRPVRVPTAANWLRSRGFEAGETVAVAPALGLDAERTAALRGDPAAWSRLLEVEEQLGREPARWDRAAAVLVAFKRSGSGSPS
ncbi:MAG: hypothetical protein L3J87_03990 [Thermoplasmata archaeon]|nr:hypothetical protein [Thermoplasmata archaeon]